MGTIIIGKMESGVVVKGQTLTVMPNRVSLFKKMVLFTVFIYNSRAAINFLCFEKNNFEGFHNYISIKLYRQAFK